MKVLITGGSRGIGRACVELFAKEGHESLYNIYIMEEIQTIFALGGGASTKMVKGDLIERVFNPKEAGDYIKRIDEIIEKKKKAVEFLKD